MTAARTRPAAGIRARPTRALVAVVLVVLGLGSWALYRFLVTGQDQSFAPGAVPPRYVELTAGKTYSLATPGGVDELQNTVSLDALQCSYATPSGSARALSLTVERPETKATNRIATFVAPLGGRLHLECTGVPRVFVDDADGVHDTSGWFLVLGALALTVGLPLLLSVARQAQASRPTRPDRSARPREQHEIE